MTDICGVETTKGEPCQNPVDSCPWHNVDEKPDNGRDTKLSLERQEQIATAIEQGKSLTSAARMAGVDRTTVYGWLDKGEAQEEGIYAEFYNRLDECGFNEREHADVMKRVMKQHSGEDSWHWKDNNRNYRGPNWHRQRKKALERSDYCCESCGVSDKEHRKKYDYGLHVHHIIARDNFADTDPEQNKLENLSVLCHRCHEMYEGSNLSPVQREQV